MLTGLTSFDEMLHQAELGDNENVDLTVGDIYGGDYSKFGLKSSTIAASFGKAIMWTQSQHQTVEGGESSTAAASDGDTEKRMTRSASLDSLRFTSPVSSGQDAATGSHEASGVTESGVSQSLSLERYAACDVSRALLIMISNNIGQLAYLQALRHHCAHVYFAGNFLRRENTMAMRTLAFAIRFWSKGSMEGLFLRHEGYCGALGAFLSTLSGDDTSAANVSDASAVPS